MLREGTKRNDGDIRGIGYVVGRDSSPSYRM